MADVLDRSEEPSDPARPVVCFDERPCRLVADVRAPLAGAPGRPLRQDDAYRRNGSANVFGSFEPLRGWREMEATARRTKQDFARCMRRLADEVHPDAEVVRVVLDNLSTHTKAALSDTFPPAEARRLARKLEFHHTPKHGSWLNAVEIEFAALGRQCLDRRIGDLPTLARETAAWTAGRNATAAALDWQFRTADARTKLRRLCPTIADPNGR